MARIEYWLQIENHPWDVAPAGVDRLTGAAMTRGPSGLFRPMPQQALIIRRYTPNWAEPDDCPINAWDLNEPDPKQTKGTVPGATLEAKVGDELLVHFRNMDQRTDLPVWARTHSFYAQGLNHVALYDGTYPFSPADPAQENKQGDRVAPGESFDYRYTVPHLSNAGAWFYHDNSIAARASIRRGAFGVIVVRKGGEGRAQLPAQALHGAADTPTRFAAVPQPATAVEHILVWHELEGVGVCINGRQLLGNTPSLLSRVNTRLKFRALNLTDRPQVLHIHGHRWGRGDTWSDSESIGTASGATLELLEGTAENGGGNGEWNITSLVTPDLRATLVVTDGGPLQLAVGVPTGGSL